MSTLTTSISQWVRYASRSPTTSSASSERSSAPSSHLEAVLLDYKQFLAARIIQCHVRGWLYRKISRRQAKAATTISRWWRGFWVRSHLFASIEAQLQQRHINYYNHMANKVQSLFRGWQTRMKCQDFQGMKQLRLQYAEDMVSALAKSLHEMRTDRLLPGIYGLRGSALLNNIEGLSQTFGYRFHNGRMRAAIAQKRAQLAERRNEFQEAKWFTPTPFPGPDSPIEQTPDFCLAKSIGTLQQRVFLLYDKCNRDRHVKNIHLKVSARLRYTMALNREQLRSRFCKELIRRSLPNNSKLPMHNRLSGLVAEFFDNLMIGVEEYNCHCKPKVEREGCN